MTFPYCSNIQHRWDPPFLYFYIFIFEHVLLDIWDPKARSIFFWLPWRTWTQFMRLCLVRFMHGETSYSYAFFVDVLLVVFKAQDELHDKTSLFSFAAFHLKFCDSGDRHLQQWLFSPSKTALCEIIKIRWKLKLMKPQACSFRYCFADLDNMQIYTLITTFLSSTVILEGVLDVLEDVLGRSTKDTKKSMMLHAWIMIWIITSCSYEMGSASLAKGRNRGPPTACTCNTYTINYRPQYMRLLHQLHLLYYNVTGDTIVCHIMTIAQLNTVWCWWSKWKTDEQHRNGEQHVGEQSHETFYLRSEDCF